MNRHGDFFRPQLLGPLEHIDPGGNDSVRSGGVVEEIHADFLAGQAGDQVRMDNGQLPGILDALYDPADAANVSIEHEHH